MTYSVYHFFKHLVDNINLFNTIDNLEDFPFDMTMLACKNIGQFPDLAIKTNAVDKVTNPLFSGGEFIEIKDSKTYSVSSFNSTIPQGQKDINEIIKSQNSAIKKQMEETGNHIYSLPVRDVYYLLRGKHNGNSKIILVHGSFFETIKKDNLIRQAFEQVLDERLKEKKVNIQDDVHDILIDIFSDQKNFSRVRNIDNASVKLRFRVMTEVKPEGNILNTAQYPQIKDNTINLIVPNHYDDEQKIILERFSAVYDETSAEQFSVFKIKHHLNGYFTVFQKGL
ncbi:MAG: hypothetical protein Ta2F_16810 [Termitinemataceae bacterium]|nr:MAG: hypothetical protein Ta2F_16810 [Termitinemataceae bacterium]